MKSKKIKNKEEVDEMEEEGLSLQDKIADILDTENFSETLNDAVETVRSRIMEALDKVSDKESSAEISFEDLGVNVGEKRCSATGSIKISLHTVR